MRRLSALVRDSRGLSTVEYILILVIVAITSLLLWQTFGSSVGTRVEQATGEVENMDGTGGGTQGPRGDTAGTQAAAAITEGRSASGMGTASGMEGGAAERGEAGAESAMSLGMARRVGGPNDGEAAGFEGGGEAAAVDEGPDLWLWIGWLLVLLLAGVTVFSVLGKRAGKG